MGNRTKNKPTTKAADVTNPSATEQQAVNRLADVARAIKHEEKQAKKAKTTDGLPALPKMPKLPRKVKAKDCECGCKGQTRGGRFLPGHDARLHAWAIRVERGVVKADDVPEMHREAVKLALAKRAAKKTEADEKVRTMLQPKNRASA